VRRLLAIFAATSTRLRILSCVGRYKERYRTVKARASPSADNQSIRMVRCALSSTAVLCCAALCCRGGDVHRCAKNSRAPHRKHSGRASLTNTVRDRCIFGAEGSSARDGDRFSGQSSLLRSRTSKFHDPQTGPHLGQRGFKGCAFDIVSTVEEFCIGGQPKHLYRNVRVRTRVAGSVSTLAVSILRFLDPPT
jgi:hypothetical protein